MTDCLDVPRGGRRQTVCLRCLARVCTNKGADPHLRLIEVAFLLIRTEHSPRSGEESTAAVPTAVCRSSERPNRHFTQLISCTCTMNGYFLSNAHTSWVERPRHYWVERSRHYWDDVNDNFLDDSECNPCWIVWLFPGLHYNVILNTTSCTHVCVFGSLCCLQSKSIF